MSVAVIGGDAFGTALAIVSQRLSVSHCGQEVLPMSAN